MNTQLDMLIRMRDQLSKPLTDQQKALKQVNTQIKELIRTQKLEEKEQLKAIKEQQKAKKAADEWKRAIGAEMAAALKTTAALAAAAALAIAGLAAAFALGTLAAVKFITSQSVIGEKLGAQYKLFGQGDKTRDMIDDLAARMHVGPDALHKVANELLQSGIKPQRELQKSVEAITALQKTGNEAAASKLQGLFTRAAESRRAFGGRGMLGISRTEATEALGAGGWERLQAELRKSGAIVRSGYGYLTTTADQGNRALAKVINEGPAGKIAKNLVGGLDQVLERARAEVRRFFNTVSRGEGFKAFIASLHSVIDAFEAFGKQGAAKGSVSLIDKGFKLLSIGVNKVLILTLHLVIWTLKFATAVVKAYGAIKEWVKQGDRLNTIKAALLGVGLLLGVILVTVGLLTAALVIMWAVLMLPLLIVVGLFALLGIAIYKVTKNFRTWKQEAKDAVAGLIDGLVSGITKGVLAIQDAAKRLGKGVISGIKTALDMHSPSREMMKLGAFAAQGFQGGLDANGKFSLPSIQPVAGAGGRGGGVSVTWTGDVVIQGGTNMGPDELKPLMMDAFADAVEKMAVEFG